MSKLCSAEEAVNHVNSNQRVFIHGGAATPLALLDALVEESSRLRNVELIHLHTSGEAKYASPEYEGTFRVANLFVGGNLRGRLDGDRVDYLPCFLSEIPQLFRSGRRALDVAMVQVSPGVIASHSTLVEQIAPLAAQVPYQVREGCAVLVFS